MITWADLRRDIENELRWLVNTHPVLSRLPEVDRRNMVNAAFDVLATVRGEQLRALGVENPDSSPTPTPEARRG